MAQRTATAGQDSLHLNEKQRRAVELVAVGKTLGDVAEAVDVDRATLWRWRRTPDFLEAVARLRLDAQLATVAALRDNTARAAQVIRELLDDQQAPPQVRLAAAKVALDANPSLHVVDYVAGLERTMADPWDALAINTARRAAEMTGREFELLRCKTPGQYWAGAGFPAGSFRHLERLRAKDDLAAGTSYCERLLAERRAWLDAAAFGQLEGDEDESA